MTEIRVGISGWTYSPWRGVFYPKKLPHDRELEFASHQLNTIEINGSFYSLQRPSSYLKWYSATPDDFIFAVKAGRYITHIRRLKGVHQPLANFFASGVLALREKLGPILWQLPPNFKFDEPVIEDFLTLLPRDTGEAADLARMHDDWLEERSFTQVDRVRKLRHAIEVRNETFRNPRFYRLLRKFHVALVFSHSAGVWPYFEELTSDFLYLRLHGEGKLYSGSYAGPPLRKWGDQIIRLQRQRRFKSVYVYFDNDVKVNAPFDAIALLKRLTDFRPESEFLAKAA